MYILCIIEDNQLRITQNINDDGVTKLLYTKDLYLHLHIQIHRHIHMYMHTLYI